MKLYWVDKNGGRKDVNFVQFLENSESFTGGAKEGALAYFDGGFYLFDGTDWIPFCKCNHAGSTDSDSDSDADSD